MTNYAMNSRRKVPVTDVFTDDFIQRHSKYKSLEEMVKASGVGEMKNILTPPFAIFCCYMTDFHSWEDMVKAAKAEYLQRRQIAK